MFILEDISDLEKFFKILDFYMKYFVYLLDINKYVGKQKQVLYLGIGGSKDNNVFKLDFIFYFKNVE